MDVKVFNPKAATEEEILARVLHRDGLMLVIDKPAGLSVHRGPKGGPSLEDWFDALRFGLPRGPALAHRLDRETSGCLVLGRHRKALAHLSLLFKHRRVGKTYWAVVEGGPEADEGTIDMPLGRLDPDFGWWMKPDPDGQPAVTKWKVMGRSGEPERLAWLALEPVTGRTHQLRVHCAAHGLSDLRRRHLRQRGEPAPRAADQVRAARGRTGVATACARGRGADLEEQGSGARGRAGAVASAGAVSGMRMEWGQRVIPIHCAGVGAYRAVLAPLFQLRDRDRSSDGVMPKRRRNVRLK